MTARLSIALLWIGMFGVVPSLSRAQIPSSNIGLPAVAAIGAHAGVARLERSSNGQEAGLLLDLGWLRGRTLRLQAEVSITRASLTEYLELEDSTFTGNYYDLSGGATVVWVGADARMSPYVLAGVAVHVLSSAFQTIVLDQRYNANRFGSHIGAGLRVRFGATRQALYTEVRRIIADEVDRTVWRIGGLVLLNDLFHRPPASR